MSEVILSPLIQATVLKDSISKEGVRLTTMELVYPRFIHSELMTHRVFSRNASSSRAIPTKRAIRMIRERPAVPASWRMNEPGMQGYQVAPDHIAQAAQKIWLLAMEEAIERAEEMDALGIHKQVVNRLTEPFSHIKVVVTSVYWDNWFGLRYHEAADPTIKALAAEMQATFTASQPKLLEVGEWHLPYVSDEELQTLGTKLAIKVSAARCARTSYNNHDGTPTTAEADIKLHDRLLVDQPIHASPAEHQATPDFKVGEHDQRRWAQWHLHGNLAGWAQYRKMLPNENIDKVIE